MKIQVSYKDPNDFRINQKDDEVLSISVLHKSENLLILDIETKTKHPVAEYYGENAVSYFSEDSLVTIRVVDFIPENKYGYVSFQSRRYGAFFTLFSQPDPKGYETAIEFDVVND